MWIKTGFRFAAGVFFLALIWPQNAVPQENGKEKVVHLLYSSSSHGYFDPCG